ncbi:hypothetical protein RRG08_053348 [Elysia crispata]|uniref:Uncharacterized protein n=1 Tax=Elysia crispata TaxID=231223 RepID=A0AAE0ZLP4_9GAST|nr:hypothetical protein RRG08_053348 [Elysia crispata]
MRLSTEKYPTDRINTVTRSLIYKYLARCRGKKTKGQTTVKTATKSGGKQSRIASASQARAIDREWQGERERTGQTQKQRDRLVSSVGVTALAP